MDGLKKTPLFELHNKLGAKIVEFGGWAMPVQYSSILEEHRAVRERVGIFDVSHMGEISVKGRDAFDFLQYVLTNNMGKLEPGKIVYSLMLYESGGTVDDLLVYQIGENDYLLVVNASNTEKDFNWIKEHAQGFEVEMDNISSMYGEVAVQGPKAEATLQKLTDFDLKSIPYYGFKEDIGISGIKVLISRTGYTGEDGFEVYMAPDKAGELWEAIMEAGKEYDILPCGLGARDTLRFEARMPLYGHELDENTTPLEAGLSFAVSFDKDFIGKDALLKEKEEGLKKKLVGFEMVDKGIPRKDYEVYRDGEKVGYVTTGTHSPTLEKNIGLAYVKPGLAKAGEELSIMIRGKANRAVVVKTPFYKRQV
ncbi:MAG: glycine cleavage system aminomethyltransferase GcvT [Thermoanaerobacteraceae bacterium]|nr:glycine cleavage system aminomethyltransferase GcvT [Thermoanaerobacteraceae bacterium]